MLGNFTRGMIIKIPASFQSNGKAIEANNVLVKIEHYDKEENKVIHDLSDSPMKQVSASDYIYEYEIPQGVKEGSYLVRISAQIPRNNNAPIEALEQFNIVVSENKIMNAINVDEHTITGTELVPKPTINNSNDFFNKFDGESNGQEKTVEDLVVDVENNPIKGVHVNVFLKKDFRPNDNQNIKVASSMTDENGKWVIKLPLGEYVFVYRAIGHKEMREFRKV